MSKRTNLKRKQQEHQQKPQHFPRVTEKQSVPRRKIKIDSTYTVQKSELSNGAINTKVYTEIKKKIKKEKSFDPSPDLFPSSFSEDSQEITYDLTLSSDSSDESFTLCDEVTFVLRKDFGSLSLVKPERSAELWKEIIQDPSSSETSSDEDFRVTRKK